MNVKRWVAIFLALVVVLSLLTGAFSTAFAAEAYTIGLRDSNQKSKVTAEPGSTVEAYLYLAGNPGILSAGALVKCPNGIKLTKAASALLGHNFTPTWQFSKSYDTNPYLVWLLAPTGTSSKGLVTYNGNWCKLTFQLDDELAEGDYTIRLSAPKDKNLTAKTSGGVIKPNSNSYVTGITVSHLTISVEKPTCNHGWTAWTTTVAATCLKAGKQERECTVCHTRQEKVIDATGHAMGSWTQTVKPTCTKAGSEKRTCQNGCGYAETRTVAKLEHRFEEMTVEKEATCEKEGLKSGVCILCKEKRTEKIPRLQHKFSAPKVVKKPTCTEDGQEAGVCERCGKKTTQTIPATGHDYAAAEIVRQPTAQKPGLKQSKCRNCDAVKKTEIPCIPEETTAATTEVSTETTTEATTEATTLPQVTTEAQTPTGEATPEETQPASDSLDATTLKNVLILASALLLGVLILIVILAICSEKKAKKE